MFSHFSAFSHFSTTCTHFFRTFSYFRICCMCLSVFKCFRVLMSDENCSAHPCLASLPLTSTASSAPKPTMPLTLVNRITGPAPRNGEFLHVSRFQCFSENLCALMVASCAPNVGQRSSRRTGPNGNMSRRGFIPLQNWGVYICLGQQNRALALEKQYIAKRDHIRTLLRPHGRRGFSKRTSENLCALMVASCAPNVGQRSSRRTGPNGNMSCRGFMP